MSYEMTELTADDVRDLIERHSDASGGNGRDFYNGAYEVIADELNAELGSERESELRDALNDVAEKWAIAQVQAADSLRRCKLLEALVRDWQELYENPDYGECVRLTDRTRKLGIEVEQ